MTLCSADGKRPKKTGAKILRQKIVLSFKLGTLETGKLKLAPDFGIFCYQLLGQRTWVD